MDTSSLLLAVAQNAVALLIIIDPLGALPVYLALERGADAPARRRSANLIFAVALLILLLSATVGRGLLQLFSVGLAELMIAGGLLLMLVGTDLIFRFLPQRDDDPESSGIVPLACPLLAGPGAIVTTMLTVERYPLPYNYLIAFAGVSLALLASWVCFFYSEFVMRVLGARGLLVLAKLVGILVAAIGTHFILQGLGDFWKLCQMGL